ncbi:type 1 glutamine amidotransferase [Pokkaliibacter sp. CJK22405]|uniref:type 1 glutamine amidotransferase n=1 Tax=Pokkaliibacter sp. CJK22405 TaxID=3384615 RepID=UPI003984D1DC
MHVQVLQHAPFEDIGNMRHWLAERGAHFHYTRLFDNEPLPPASEPDFLIILGGPMSVHDEATLPWLVPEKAFIAEYLALGKPALGICLGAQLIAVTQNATVNAGKATEIGWFALSSTAGADEAGYQLPQGITVMHWHNETFSIPAGAVLLGSTEVCANQGFRLGEKVLGFQFHLELDRPSLEKMIAHEGEELAEQGAYIQTAEAMLNVPDETFHRCDAEMGRVLAALLD